MQTSKIVLLPRQKLSQRIPSGIYVLCLATQLFFSYTNGFELKPETLLTKKTVLGHSVHLPCELPSLPDNPQLILWLKNQNTKPFYSYDARQRLSGPRKQNGSDLQKRSSFTYNKKTYIDKVVLGHLKVSNVTPSDAGNYTCRVDFLKAQTKIALLQLEIIEPIWRMVVQDSHGREINRKAGPLKEEDRLYLVCKAHGGHPAPLVEWVSEGRVLSSSNDYQEAGSEHILHLPRWESSNDDLTKEIQAVLKVSPLKREDLGRTFTCRANNSVLTPVKTRSVKLDMSLKPAHIEINSPRNPLWEGKEVEFVCRSWGSRPPALLKWTPENLFKMKSSQEALDQNSTTSRARLIATPEDDGRIINCTASNPSVPHYKISTTRVLTVHYAPQLEAKLASFLNPLNIKEGDDVFFQCIVKANPLPNSIVWLHNNQEIQENRDKGIILHERDLVFQTVSRDLRGIYKCRAANSIGTATSKPVQLDIMFAPECRHSQNVSVSISADEEVMLNCSVDSFPSPEKYLWRVNGSNGWEKVNQSKVKSSGFSSLFIFSSARSSKSAHYDNSASLDSDDFHHGSFKSPTHNVDSFATVYCLATNVVGRQREPCVFHITPAGPPGDLVSCSLVNQSANTLGVSCIPGHSGGLNQRFHAKVIDDVNQSIITEFTSLTPQFIIRGLQSGRDYVVIVTAVNDKGKSQPYYLQGFALKVAENKISEDHSSKEESPLAGLFFGIISGFLIVLSLIIAFTRAHCRKHNLSNSHKKHPLIDEASLEPLSPGNRLTDQSELELTRLSENVKVNGPDVTAQTPDSIISDHTVKSDDICKKGLSDGSIPAASTPPPPLLGLSNTYCGSAGIPRSSSQYGMTPRSKMHTTTLPRMPRTLQQPLHSEELSKMSSNAKKYYTLKINCTRQNNESFV